MKKLKTTEEKLKNLLKHYHSIVDQHKIQVDDLDYDKEFLSKQMYKQLEDFKETENKYKKNIDELNDIIYELQRKIEYYDNNTLEISEKIKIDLYQKMNELKKKHENEIKEIMKRNDEAYNDLRIFYQHKLKTSKEKLREKFNVLNERSNQLIESLSSKLDSKIKVVKQQKSEISDFKTQLKYMDSTIKIFTPHRESNTNKSATNKSLEMNKKTTFLKPSSVLGHRLKKKF